ncbi:MAG TPA: hypothetical protein VIF57_18190 [Polyangia bacterium]
MKLLLSFAAASSMSACIIPVGPEFQDPPGAPNSSPEILDPDPLWGAEVTGMAPDGKTFKFAVTDPNNEELYLRWIVDGRTVPGPGMASPADFGTPLTKQVTCTDVDVRLSRHAITAVVADRTFFEGDPDLYRIHDQGLSDKITWTLNLTCPVSP